jgi:3-oxoacyl-[acyl-carrier protein] reductase
MSNHDLSGKTALVTGASTGIGAATARALAAAGATVGIHYNTSRESAEGVLDDIQSTCGQGLLVQADLTDDPAAEAIVDEVVNATGRLDILFNNAGSPVERASIEECSIELWRKVLDTNLTGAFIVTRRAIPHLRATGNGAIVNNLSLAVQTGGANGAGHYAAAKGGLQVMTRTLARELAPEVRVNSIMPGVIETPHHEKFTSDQRMQEYREETPLNRNGRAEEVAGAVLFLVSEASSFVNGAMIDVNGGRFLR